MQTALGAWAQKWLDGMTNSAGQGFRLEGFDCPPDSMNSVFDHADSVRHGVGFAMTALPLFPRAAGTVATELCPHPAKHTKYDKLPAVVCALRAVIRANRLHRFLLQRQPANEFLNFFLDLHKSTDSTWNTSRRRQAFLHSGRTPKRTRPSAPESTQKLSNIETQELLLLQCIEELAGLVAACRAVPTPQQWIGSSVMLAFDSKFRPSRIGFAAERLLPNDVAVITKARAHIFDWGRSEFNTPDMQEELTESERVQRAKHWGYYCGGLGMLLYDCCLVYARRFLARPQTICLSAWDRDVYSGDDLIGVHAHALASNKLDGYEWVALPKPEKLAARAPKFIYVLGPPGCGKGTHCKLLAGKFGFVHLSVGALLVSASCELDKPSETTLVAEGIRAIKVCIEQGSLVAAKVVISLLQKAMEAAPEGSTFLIDGFPRGLQQATLFEATVCAAPQFTIFFDGEHEELKDRILERGRTSGRADDCIEVIMKRFEVYENESHPVVQYLKDQHLGEVIRVETTGRPIADVFEDVLEKLKQTVTLENLAGSKVTSLNSSLHVRDTTLSFTLTPLVLPEPSRLVDSWELSVHGITNAPRLDACDRARLSQPSPFVVRVSPRRTAAARPFVLATPIARKAQ